MANPEHLAILKKGVAVWNAWREEVPQVNPNLSSAKLRWADLSTANLASVNLRRANLSGANLSNANLSGADLSEAYLRDVDLSGAVLTGANLFEADLRQADLSSANLTAVDLNQADLSEADLSEADVNEGDLRRANLSGANLSSADMTGANFQGANLQFTRLNEATLTGAKLWETLRAGWTIEGVRCERLFWDEAAQQPTEYAPAEFEKHHSEQHFIELFYRDGIRRFELNTLPALIHHLEARQGCTLRLKSVEEAPGGTKVSIVVEESGQSGTEQLQQAADDLRIAQTELRDEKRRSQRLEIEKALLLDDVLPRMLAAGGHRIISDRGSSVVFQSPLAQARSQQTISDLQAIRDLVTDITCHRTELPISTEQQRNLASAIEAIEQQLEALHPDSSVLSDALRTVRNVLEGAAGSILASAWLQPLSQFIYSLG